jgi:hypothetical protein
VGIVNCAHGLEGNEALTTDKLTAADETTCRFAKKAEGYFRSRQMPPFDPYLPAEWLIENPKIFNVNHLAIDRTLKRAEALITAINRLFGSSYADCSIVQRPIPERIKRRSEKLLVGELAQRLASQPVQSNRSGAGRPRSRLGGGLLGTIKG